MKFLYVLLAATAVFAAAPKEDGYFENVCKDDLRGISCDGDRTYHWPKDVCNKNSCKNCFESNHDCNKCGKYLRNEWRNGVLRNCNSIDIDLRGMRDKHF